MKISKFKSGKYISQTEYKCFLPERINCEWIIDKPHMLMLLEEASLKLGEMNAYSRHIPDVDTFIRMHIVKEATTSSKIEGTKTEIGEAALNEKLILPEKKDDWQEVQNYIEAMNQSITSLDKLPLSSRLMRKAHSILMQGVRGKNKNPGEFRKSQNWIGGATLKDAYYIPPNYQYVSELMTDLEQFLHNNLIQVPHLVKIALAHYQFESIHPFLDGNGRIGRLLITLYLVDNKIIEKPLLYLSSFFEKNKNLYYDNLNRVRTHNELEQWIKFFLVGISETANDSLNTLQKISQLYEEYNKIKIVTLGKRMALATKVVNFIFRFPTFTASELVQHFKITKPTANAIINEFMKLNILQEKTGQKRNRIFVCNDYLNLFL